MSDNTTLTGIELASALSEHIYRRSDRSEIDRNDHGISLAEVGCSSVDVGEIDGLFRSEEGAEVYYYAANGFCGQVVEKNGAFIVVFRGTDATNGFPGVVIDALMGNVSEEADDRVDQGDLITNQALGPGGTLQSTQLESAIALMQATKAKAIEVFGSIVDKVSVVGQSLGGGLAGLVAGLENVPGYAISPANFTDQFVIEITVKALSGYGISKSDIQDWDRGLLGPFRSVARDLGENLQELLERNLDRIPGLVASDISAIVSSRDALLDALAQHLVDNFEVHTIKGEFISGYPPLSLLEGHFDISRLYDVGEGSTGSLHSPTLHNLVIRTESLSNQQFSRLLREDNDVRAAFLDMEGVVGLQEGDRADPREPAAGGSGLAAYVGGSSHIFLNVLWKSVGVEGGFYEKFYQNFSSGLANGAVHSGSSLGASIHRGFAFLGLQTVRDAITRDDQTQIVLPQGFDPFSIGRATNGLVVNLDHISHASPLGVAELNQAFNEAVLSLDGTYVQYLSDAKNWRIAVAHNGSTGSALLYGMTHEGAVAPADIPTSGHLVFAWDGDDRIATSSGDDYIYAGHGDDIVEAGSGKDVIVGGENGSYGDTVSYQLSNQGVTVNLAYASGHTGGHAVGDVLIGIENVLGSGLADNLIGSWEKNVLQGRGGDDRFYIVGDGSTAHSDLYDGGDQTDTLDLSGYAGEVGLLVDLGSLAVASDNGLSLTVKNIENVVGTKRDDVFRGNADTNIIVGGLGNDTFKAASSYQFSLGDTYDGGDGSDKIDFVEAPNMGVFATNNWTFHYSIDLASGLATGPNGFSVRLISIENAAGSQYRDFLRGTAAHNKLYGNDGADYFDPDAGADIIDGGDGTDKVSFSRSGSAVNLDLNVITQSGGHAQGVELYSIEQVDATAYNDTIRLKLTDDTMTWANAGHDTIYSGYGVSLVYGDAGNDTFHYVGGKATFYGGTGVDTLNLSTSTNGYFVEVGGGAIQINDPALRNDGERIEYWETERVIGSGGNDSFIVSAATTSIGGGAGLDSLAFVESAQTSTVGFDINLHTGQVWTRTWSKKIADISGFEIVSGSSKSDKMAGGSVNATFFGAEGNDLFIGGGSHDLFNGGMGNDTIDYSYSSSAVDVDLARSVQFGGYAAGDSFASVEQIIGTTYNDKLKGLSTGDVSIRGGVGNDGIWVTGDSGTFYGEAGADTFHFEGHAASFDDAKQVYGGTGADEFYFYTQFDDVIIQDFSAEDRIYFANGLSQSDVVVSSYNSDVIVTSGLGSDLILRGARALDLSVHDFFFV